MILREIWLEPLVAPAYLSISSFLLLCLALAKPESAKHQRKHNSFGKYGNALQLLRLLACFALLGTNIYTFIHSSGRQHDIERVQSAINFYIVMLAFLVVSPVQVNLRRLQHNASLHLSLILTTIFCIYAYRNLWPLATLHLIPLDIAAGWPTWTRILLIGFAGLFFPLIFPRQHIPVNPDMPSVASPEQTCSYMSLALFSFMDSIIRLGWKHPRLGFDMLPPLPDRDTAMYLRDTSFKRLDPLLVPQKDGKPKHIFFGLARYFINEYLFLTPMLILRIVLGFASPVAVNRLLHYLETNGQGAFMRPWFWIFALFWAPFVSSVSLQLYFYVSTNVMVRIEAILTQLLFNHALRIRIKEEVASAAQEADTETEASKPSKTSTDAALSGRLNNLISSDMQNIINGRNILFLVVMWPLQVSLTVWFLYAILGWSALVGMLVTILGFPIPGRIAQYMHDVQVELMKRTDKRVQAVTETISVIRMLKSFGYEKRVQEQIAQKRETELKSIRKMKLLSLCNSIINVILPTLTMMATFASYTLLAKKPLTASVVFSSLTIFENLKNMLGFVFDMTPQMIAAKVSLDRVNDFLVKTELLDQYSTLSLSDSPMHSSAIGFHNSSFAWSSTFSSRNFHLSIPGDLHFQRGVLNLIVGGTGTGKTSLLLALLGELHFIPLEADAWYNLPRDEGVAYSAQEPWILNDTIKNNIIFGCAFDETRYAQVLHQCALQHDLSLFNGGDMMEVGEKGITLSGGQKARISLARAVYSEASIVLLDDVLSALDVQTSRWIVDECLAGSLLQDRTVILVTHQLALVGPKAQRIISIALDGKLSVQDPTFRPIALPLTTLPENGGGSGPVPEIVDAPNLADTPEPVKLAIPLITDEKVEVGHVGLGAAKFVASSLGGPFFWTVFLGTSLLYQVSIVLQTWYLGYWATQYEDNARTAVPIARNIVLYGSIVLAGLLIYCVSFATFTFGAVRSSRRIHARLLSSVISATLRFLDTTPMGRMMSRFTSDIQTLDGPFLSTLDVVVNTSASLLIKFITICALSPAFLLPGLFFGLFNAVLSQIYLRAQLSIKREASMAKAPVLSHFSASVAGLVSIRAYGASNTFEQTARTHIDKYTQVTRISQNLPHWMSIRTDIAGGLFTAGLAWYLVYLRPDVNASEVGLQLNLAVGITIYLMWWIQQLNELEVQANSAERILGYVNIEQEPQNDHAKKPPAAWPASGDIVVEGLSARYSHDGPDVLHRISFNVKSGEKIGIVGRTGSGKSSLALSLLRLIPTDGQVIYDGISTDILNLEDLRGNITVIPQQPELLSGTLRENLDPLHEHDDAVLNDALRAAGHFTLQGTLPEEQKITLDSQVGSGGANFSTGQRQILALARALVRQSKVLILDEATASLDRETDTFIQNSLQNEFRDCTLLIIAHRLQTIMDADKILVLEAGRLVEFDNPLKLLIRNDTHFRKLVDESVDKDTLYKMATSRIKRAF